MSKTIYAPNVNGKSGPLAFGAEYTDEKPPKDITDDASHPYSIQKIEHLPTEILHQIAWFSFNPDLPLVSKAIFSKLPPPSAIRHDMILHLFNGWPAAHQKPNLLRFKTPLGQFADPLLADTRLTLQATFVQSPWCTLKSLKLATKHVLLTWILTYWDMNDNRCEKKDYVLEDVLARPDLIDELPYSVFQFENATKDYILSLNGYSLQVFKWTDDDADICSNIDGEDDVECAERMEETHLITTPHKPDRMLIPPVTNQKDNPVAYSSWSACLCAWAEALWYISKDKPTDSRRWDHELLIACIESAIKNENTAVVTACLEWYSVNISSLRCENWHCFDTLDDGFVLRMKDLCAQLGRWDYVWQLVAVVHGGGGTPVGWFTKDDIEAILVAGNNSLSDRDVKTLAARIRKFSPSHGCACVGREFQD